METDTSDLDPEEREQLAAAMRILESQPPLPSEAAVQLSTKLALERFVSDSLDDASEHKYSAMFDRGIAEGLSHEEASQLVAHNRVGDRAFNRMPQKVREQIYAAMRSDLVANAAPNERAAPGDRVADGTIYAGISPDTGKPMYTTPADALLTYTFNEARNYAASLNAHSHNDWRVPTKAELNVLWVNREKGALKETFNGTGSYPAGWYWSSTEDFSNFVAWDQRFSDGTQSWIYKDYVSSLRCVRG